MSWEDIDFGKYDSIIKEVKSLIRIRKQYRALKDSQIQWNDTKGRLISYARPGDVTIEVYLNAEEQPIPMNLQEREIIFSRGYSNQTLLAGGTLIVRRNLQ